MSKTKISPKLILISQTALLSAVAVVLSILESILPDFPFILPGMKLGLGNIAVLLAVEICPLAAVLYIALVKSLFALVTRGATAFLMSFAGSLLSALMMYIAARNKRLSFGCFGIGITGSFFHNIGQLTVAFFIVGNAAWGYFPVVSLFSLFTGALTGLVHYFVLPNVKRITIFK